MRSIPAALTWELLDRGRWSLPAAALGALAFPVLVLSALSQVGALDPDDRSMLIMHFVMVQMNIVGFGAALTANAWTMSRLYAHPASTATLVTWRLLPAMIAVAVETVAWTAAINAMFHLDWPLWGPALLSATALAAVLAAFWLTERSRWVIVALTVVGAVLGLWFKSRYGGMFSDPTHFWDAVTPTEVFTLLGFTALAWRIAVVGVARNRRGEPPFSLGLIAWLDRVLDRAPTRRAPFRSPAQAQFWYEWRHGLLASAMVVGIGLIALTIWVFSSRDPQFLVEGVLGGVIVLLCAALVNGAAMGNISPRGDLVMGHFLATRPMTPTAQAHTILRAAAASLLLAWAVWAAALALAYAVCAAADAWPSPLIPQDQDWRLILLALVGSWVVMSSLISAILTGRSRPMIQLFGVAVAAYIAFMVAANYALTPAVREQVMLGAVVALGVALALGTIAAFVVGRRRRLVDAPTTWAAFAIWAALIVVSVLALPPDLAAPQYTYVLLIGALALAVAPLAAAPLAVAWNRHR